MSSILSPQAVVLGTAMAVSGAVIFLALSRQKSYPSAQFSRNHNSHPTKQGLRSCLSSDDKKRERKKKRVHFAENVKDPSGNSEEFRKEHRRSVKFGGSCRAEIPGIPEVPENRIALYNGILRDRVRRMECSF
ncbi:hypothetical protein L1049_005223 [Liquidambar formosana]|uniref:Uncharacterized protein n=1 Tax=Liquidambar formosana TaxID=63359 RepID=A0AAP0WWG4_LIQFO